MHVYVFWKKTLRVNYVCVWFTWLMLGWPLLFLLEWVSRPHSEEKRLLRLLVERDIACVRRLTPLSVRAATYRHKTAAWGTGTTFILCVPAIKLTRRLLAGVWDMNTAARWNSFSLIRSHWCSVVSYIHKLFKNLGINGSLGGLNGSLAAGQNWSLASLNWSLAAGQNWSLASLNHSLVTLNWSVPSITGH